MHLCLKVEAEPASKMSCFFKQKDDAQSPPPKKIMSVDFTLFPLLFTYDNLAMQASVWLCKLQFAMVQFGASYANLRPPHIYSRAKFKEKNLVLHWSKYGNSNKLKMHS